MKNQFITRTEEYVRNLFLEKSSPELIYHDIRHTSEVVRAVKKLGEASELSDTDIEILLIAAWLHDIGYILSFDNHEETSCRMAEEFLVSMDYDNVKIDKVTSAIMSTKLPQSPKSVIEELLCDADLHHLGTDQFNERNELFRLELERRLNKAMSDSEWLKTSIDFVINHKFFTTLAREKYQEEKEKNLLKLQKRLRKKESKQQEEDFKDAKFSFEKEKLKKKKEEEKKADRGVETMFRNVMRTHVAFSSMADNKANIMISVNTLLLGAIATLLARKLDANPHLIVPTVVLSIVSLTTLIYAILATRPSITHGKFTKEDIDQKKANLLFFGNFHEMDLDNFTWGMTKMMEDKDYLYDSMIKDFYFLGQVLGRKYKLLRVCYNIFMFGMVISIILFIIFIVMYPNGMNQLGNILD